MAAPVTQTSAALQALARELRDTGAEFEQLIARAERLSRAVDAGAPLVEAMAAEPRPLLITRMTEIIDRLHAAGGAVRRTEARQLRTEGCTQDRIAQIFGVTRQRVSVLLKPTSRRRPKRPRPR